MYEPVSRSSNVILHASPSQCPRWRQSFPTQLKGIHTRPLIFSVYTVLLCSEHWYSRRRGQENMGSCRLYQNVRICWGILHREFDRTVSMSCYHRSEDVWTLVWSMDHHFHNRFPFFSRVPSRSTSWPILKPHSWLHHRGSEVVYEPPHLSNCPCCEN